MRAERRLVVVPDDERVLPGRQRETGRHDKLYAAGDGHAAEVERRVGAIVVQLKVIEVRPGGSVVHQLGQHEMGLEAFERVRLAGPEFDRVGPVTPALGVVEHPHTRAIPVPDLGQARGQGDLTGELGQYIRFPVGVDLVLARAGRVVRWRVRCGDFGQAPLYPGELPARVGEC